jgi:hypothetical protein
VLHVPWSDVCFTADVCCQPETESMQLNALVWFNKNFVDKSTRRLESNLNTGAMAFPKKQSLSPSGNAL